MGIVVKSLGIYLIVASLTLDDVTTSNLSNTIKDGRVVIGENGTETQMQEPKPPVDPYEQLATDEIFPSRLRRSIDIETVPSWYNAVISGIAEFIRQGKGNLASRVYFKAIQTEGTPFATSKRTELVEQIITNAYQLNATSNILEFISSKLNEPSEVCIWLTVLFETMKKEDHLASIEGLQLGRAIQKLKRLQNSNKNIDSRQECDLQLLTHRISNDLIEPTEQLLAEWAKSIQSGNDSSVISAAINHPLAFHFIVSRLIPKAIVWYNSNNQISFFHRSKKTIDFINRIPSLVTTIDALDHFIETLFNVEPKAVAMSEGFMLAYSVKEVEAYVANTTQFPLKYQQKLTKLKNLIPQNIKKIVWDPYVLIYKQDKTNGEIVSRFMSNDYRGKSNKCLIPYKSNRDDESNKWILEPINNADLFRIKNKESGEYLYAGKNTTLYERSVCTYKLNEGSDVNINSLGDQSIWKLIPRWTTEAEQFVLINIWKEYLDDDWEFYNNTVITWITDPPESAYNWIISDGRAKPRLVCFFYSLASQGAIRFTADDIDPSLCTHLIYSEAKLGLNTLMIQIGNEIIDIREKGYEKFVALKNQNPNLKVMILLNGHGMDEKFLRLSSDTINIFVESIINFLQRYKFDGIHIDLEYWQSQSYDITSLITALSDALKSRNYLLSATLSSSYDIISTRNDIPLLNQMLDFISIRGFHYNQREDKAYHHAPLFHIPGDKNISYNVDDIVKKVISQGVSPSKIVLGISFCGTPLTLTSDDVKLMAPARTKQNGHHMFYSEICAVIQNRGWQAFQDPEQRVGPYAVSPSGNDRTWISYDDPAMAIVKSKYILSKGLGGVYVWDVSMDDYQNICGNGVNPMLTAIADTFKEKPFVATEDP